jgi:hypothetical protein
VHQGLDQARVRAVQARQHLQDVRD